MKFEQPEATPIKPEGTYRLKRDYTYTRFGPAGGVLWSITVLKGFIWAGASVPQWLWSLTGMTRDGLIRAAALIHDLMYRGPNGTVTGCSKVFTRKEADVILYEIAREAGCSWWTAWRAYRAVRWFGWWAWKTK